MSNMANGPELKKVKTKTTSKLKKELDVVYSKWLRQKYSKDGMVTCYTCGKSKEIAHIQCGHFISRKELSTRWDERNTRPQCWGCNATHLGNGMRTEFAYRLSQEYGQTIVNILYRKGRGLYLNIPYEKLIAEYKEKLLTLQK